MLDGEVCKVHLGFVEIADNKELFESSSILFGLQRQTPIRWEGRLLTPQMTQQVTPPLLQQVSIEAKASAVVLVRLTVRLGGRLDFVDGYLWILTKHEEHI